MGFKTQRQYTTTITDYENVKEAVQNSTNCRIREDSKGNFTFYLKNYPDIRIQFTSKKFFLKLHGLKPSEFISDLKVIREFTSTLRDFYPHGIDFKLDKENVNYHDKDELISRQNGMVELQQKMLNTALKNPKTFDRFKEELWKGYETDLKLHDHFARTLNNAFAEGLCKNGFRCKPDGTLKFKTLTGNIKANRIMAQCVQMITSSGFLDD